MHRFMLWQGPNAGNEDGEFDDLRNFNVRPPIVHVLVRDEANDGRRHMPKTIFTAPNMEMSENDPRQVLQNLRRNMQVAAEQNRLRQIQVAEELARRRSIMTYTGIGLLLLIIAMLYILDPFVVLQDLHSLVGFIGQSMLYAGFPFM